MKHEYRKIPYSNYNRAWCKSYINAVRHGEKQKEYRIF